MKNTMHHTGISVIRSIKNDWLNAWAALFNSVDVWWYFSYPLNRWSNPLAYHYDRDSSNGARFICFIGKKYNKYFISVCYVWIMVITRIACLIPLTFTAVVIGYMAFSTGIGRRRSSVRPVRVLKLYVLAHDLVTWKTT